MDLQKATELLADPALDGDPVGIYAAEGDDSPVPPEDPLGDEDGISAGNDNEGDDLDFPGEDGGKKRIKYVIGNVPIYVIAERVQYYGPDGRLIT